MVDKTNEVKEDLDEATARGFATLGQVLRKAKEEKDRLLKIEEFKAAGIDPSKVNLNEIVVEEIDIDSRLAGRKSKKENVNRWVIYPDDPFKQYWDPLMTM